jgi:hypothetical protein
LRGLKIKRIKIDISEVGNCLAVDMAAKKQWLSIKGAKDGKEWFRIDYSQNAFKEAETTHPEDNKQDAELIFGRYFNDLREHQPMTTWELQCIVSAVVQNQASFDANIKKHMEILDKMAVSLDSISAAFKKNVCSANHTKRNIYISKRYSSLLTKIKTLDDVFKEGISARIAALDEEEKINLDDWLFRQFGYAF